MMTWLDQVSQIARDKQPTRQTPPIPLTRVSAARASLSYERVLFYRLLVLAGRLNEAEGRRADDRV